MVLDVNKTFMVETPSEGGRWSEGIVGLPRSINPVLAFTDIDKDLSVLIYSGLMKYDNNKLIPDMASEYSISSDGLTYDFTLRDNVRFHDGKELTTDDIEFTIQKIQDGTIKSPHKADWTSVGIEKISEKKIRFILKQPYGPFLSNTTIGILPKHIWKNFDTDQFIFNTHNLEPIGSGPYRIGSIEKDKDGIPKKYSMKSFNKFHNDSPYIPNIEIHFYENEKQALDAYEKNEIENLAGISPEKVGSIASSSKKSVIIHNPLPRIFGIFFNQNNSTVLANKEVREALNIVIDKDKIIKEALYEYGIAIDGPLPYRKDSSGDKHKAKKILSDAGWLINKDGVLEKKSDKKSGGISQVLEFSISTTDSPDLKKIAEIVKKEWEDIGAKVNIKVFEYGDLAQNIIKTRKYDALLFGEVVGKELDLYAFWHSSQKDYPGLNVAMYVNSKVDKILEDMRSTSDEKKKKELYDSFEKIIKDDAPAIFLYSPEYIYAISSKIMGNKNTDIVNPSDRFYGVDKWYINTNYVWKIFQNKY